MEFQTASPPASLVTTAPYSSITRRFGASVIDFIILGVISVAFGHIIPVLGGIAAWFFYAPILEASEVRATIGKHLLGIQVSDLTGSRISFKASFLRNIMKLISGAMLLIGFFFAFFTKRKQALHDLLADTLVVYGESQIPIADAWLATTKDVLRAGKTSLDSASPVSAATTETSTEQSVVAQLERLQNLRNSGALTEAEYQMAKAKILGA